MFQDVIELLLKKKDNLREEIEREFAERAAKIDELLDKAGYIPPVKEELADVQAEEANAEPTAEPVVANEQVIY